VKFHWNPLWSLSAYLAWIPVLLLFLIGANRKPEALWILVPVTIGLIWTQGIVALAFSRETGDALSVFCAVLTGLWLGSPLLENTGKGAAVVRALGIVLVVSLCVVAEVKMFAAGILAGLIFVTSLTIGLGVYAKDFRTVRVLGAPAVILAVSNAIFGAIGSALFFPKSIVLGALLLLVIGVPVLYLLLLPYLVLSTKNWFFRERMIRIFGMHEEPSPTVGERAGKVSFSISADEKHVLQEPVTSQDDLPV
jgi:hypothetical protein